MLGDKVKKLRKNARLTQQQLADTIGVSRSTIGMLEKNLQGVGNETLLKLADFFGVTVDFLLSNKIIDANINTDTIFAGPGKLVRKVDNLKLSQNAKTDINNLSKEETTLLKNYNKLNDLGKSEANKRVAELTEINRYLNTTCDEISETKEKYITYDDFDVIAAHNDNLTDDEIAEADRRILEDINKRNR